MGSITDVPGLLVGQAQDEEGMTGCTVVLTTDGAVAGVDVRGSAPGTRETDLLDPSNLVQKIHAVMLAGGSAFGLAAATGVMTFLQERGHGFETTHGLIPIVPAAVIYDLGVGYPDRYPDALMGYLACSVAGKEVMEGNFGAGAGASIGKIFGPNCAMKSGVGTSSAILKFAIPNDSRTYTYTVGTIVITNSFGDIYKGDQILGGACEHPDGDLLDTIRLLREGVRPKHPQTQLPLVSNTTLACVATDAPLTKAAARKLAQMAQDGLSRAIRPAHTMFDGDTVFALSTGGLPPTPNVDPLLLTALGGLAADLLVQAIHRSVMEARPAGGLPCSQRML
ncbi:MAG: P1 family peptidase [Chloroflexota bacterium]|nr:P1 family peptidase [Chloroflexota bacterium]